MKVREDVIKNTSSVSVIILKTYSFAKSSNRCDLLYNDRIYKSVDSPGNIKEGYNDIDFYYNKDKDEIFPKGISYRVTYIGIILLLFFMFLWYWDTKKNGRV
ncbi:hypothetical protein PG357_04365 [Riemerella anatipestifer]|nr:hypothetical protein [Riemerella anatipestifer]